MQVTLTCPCLTFTPLYHSLHRGCQVLTTLALPMMHLKALPRHLCPWDPPNPWSSLYSYHFLILKTFLHLWIPLGSSYHHPSGHGDSPVSSPHSISAWTFRGLSASPVLTGWDQFSSGQLGNNSAKCILIQKYIVKLSLNKQMSHFKILLL